MSGPVDYSLCCQTVTAYRRTEEGIQRTVIPGCYLQWQEELDEDGIRIRDENKFLLIQPGEKQLVFPGDRVLPGVGPEIQMEEWESFAPSGIRGLVIVEYATAFRWEGVFCHTEAGRK